MNEQTNMSSSFVLLNNQPADQQSNYASAESSPTSSKEQKEPTKANNFFQNISSAFDKIKFSIGNDSSSKTTPPKKVVDEPYVQAHKEKMQEIAIGIKEFSFEKAAEPKKATDQFTFSLIDRMLARNGSLDNSPMSGKQQPTTESPMHSNNSTLSAASSSSPNPDFSPFKLLPNEVNSTTGKSIISSSYMAKLAKEGELIENLSHMSHKEQERVDPIVSGAAKASVKSPPALPSSSHEFCMDLNLNLAAAAAHNSSGPVAVVVGAKKADDYILEHNKFTSNASTCSIHNDLRKILEESSSNNSNKKLTDDSQPKPQRATLDSKQSKSSESSKASDTDLSKVLKMLIESSKNQKRFRYSRDFLLHVREQRSELIDQVNPDIFKKYPTCKTGAKWDAEKYFDLITGFDDSRNNDSFKAKSNQNNNGNKRNGQQQQRPSSTTASKNTNVIGNLLFNAKHINASTSDSPQPLQVPKNSPRFLVKDQLNELAMEINRKSIRTNNTYNNNSYNNNGYNNNKRMSDNVLSSLGLNQATPPTGESRQSDPDKYLLNLIKSDKSKPHHHSTDNGLPKEKVNILDMLTKSTNSSRSAQEKKVKHDNDLLKNLLKDNMTKTTTNHHHHHHHHQAPARHHPKVYSVEELEQDQISKLKKASLPISAEELERKFTVDRPSPLSMLGADPFKSSDNPTKLLKQLLNLKASDESKTTKSDGESKKSKKHRQHRRKRQEKSDDDQKSKSVKKMSKSSSEMPPALQSILNPIKESNSLEKLLDKKLNSALEKYSDSKRAATTSHSENNMESLLKKINEGKPKKSSNSSSSKKVSSKQRDSEHFSALLNKMKSPSVSSSASSSANSSSLTATGSSSCTTTPASSPEHLSHKSLKEKKSDGSDILKWFCKPNKPSSSSQYSPNTLSEIELMQKLRQMPK